MSEPPRCFLTGRASKSFLGRWVLVVGCWALFIFSPFRAFAHPISLSSGQAVVGSNAVDVSIDVMFEDFMMFYGVMPDADNFVRKRDLEAGAQRHKAFLLRDFVIRDTSGERLGGDVVAATPEPIPERGVKVGELMDHGVTYRLRYPLPAPPELLTFQQVFGSGETPCPAVMELEVRQEGLVPVDVVTLANDGNSEVFEFDWQASGRAGETAEEAWRRRRGERRQQRMGITSYDAIYGFIYIVDHEVRVEILIPLLTLETWQAVPREDAAFVSAAEQAAALGSMERFFCGKNVVKIDGLPVKPTLQRLDFYGVKFRDFAMRPTAGRLSAATARVGAILSYSTKGPPSRVDVTWEYFNAAVHTARTVIYAYDKAITQAFSPYRPVFAWKSETKRQLPRIAVLDAGAETRPEDGVAVGIATTLLKNIYRAFDYRNESDVYDALANSVHGDLLSELYLKIHKSLTLREQGGAVSSVKDVRVSQARIGRGEDKGGGFSAALTWTVEGTVEHWGHIHTRLNQYQAELRIRTIEGAWRITDMNVTNQERLRYEVKVRGL